MPVAVSPIPVKHAVEAVIKLKEEVIESKEDEDSKNEEQDTTVAATFIKKPLKPKPKPSDLWRKAGMNIKSKLNLPGNKGLLGVVKQAEAQGQLKPKMFNRNITKAISAMAKKQAAKDHEKVCEPSDLAANDKIPQYVESESHVTQVESAEININQKDHENTKIKQEDAEKSSKKSQGVKLGNVKQAPVAGRARSASVATKQLKSTAAVKETKPRRKSVAGELIFKWKLNLYLVFD